jgi:flagellar protein FliO/FliZ
MWDMLYYLAIVLFLAVAMIGGAYAVRQYLGGGALPSVGTFFAPKPMRRLSVSEQFNLDSKRRLILIRRDGVEHLIMTGGPVDMLIETGIPAPVVALDPEVAAPSPALQNRIDHTLG